MKAQKIMLGVIIALLVGVIIIQLVVKHKVRLDNGATGTSSVFMKPLPETELVETTETAQS